MKYQLIENINRSARHYLKYCLENGLRYQSGFRLYPGGFHTVSFANIPKGRCLLRIWHEGGRLHASSQGAYVRLRIDGKPLSLMRASSMGVDHNGSDAFFYIGGGEMDDGLAYFQRSIGLDEPIEPTSSLELVFHSLLDEPCDIVSVLLEELKPGEEVQTAISELQSLVPANAGFLICSDLAASTARLEDYADLAFCANALGRLAPTVLLLNDYGPPDNFLRLLDGHGLTILRPEHFGFVHSIDANTAVKCVRLLDNVLPKLQWVLAHGLQAADALLSDRRFAFRIVSSLPGVSPEALEGKSSLPSDATAALKRVLLHSDSIWTHSKELERRLSALAGPRPFTCCDLPPPVPGQAGKFERHFKTLTPPDKEPLICFAAHDYKFIDPYISRLKKQGFRIIRDVWRWGYSTEKQWNEHCLKTADLLFCEWGLGGALWYSNQNTGKKPLYIRIHLQEIDERASRFGREIRHENVTAFIFVSERVRRAALALFGWPEEKTLVIPNFVLSDEYVLIPKDFSGSINLGMVGVIPARKRFDRGVRLLERLVAEGLEARLHVKGPRPEAVTFMNTPRREDEKAYYSDVYERIASNPHIRERVLFEPWGNDVALWYEKMHFILSCSDFESFHYALADGVASGCVPIVWPWEDAASIYSPDWLVGDTAAAGARVKDILRLEDDARSGMIARNRELVIGRYGCETIFTALDKALGLRCEPPTNAACG